MVILPLLPSACPITTLIPKAAIIEARLSSKPRRPECAGPFAKGDFRYEGEGDDEGLFDTRLGSVNLTITGFRARKSKEG